VPPGVADSELDAREDICEQFLQNDTQNLSRLKELFAEVETLLRQLQSDADADQSRCMQTEDNMILLFQVYKGLIQLNIEQMLEVLVSDRFYVATFGALEWDPEAMAQGDERVSNFSSTLHYRDFLTKGVQFKKIIDLKQADSPVSSAEQECFPHNYSLEERIHMNYRLTFLKDTVMARYIDEICLKTINQLITRNNKEICSAIFYDGRGYMTPKEIKSIKDQIVEKIKQRDDMLLRF
jgi:hypothetical protein